MYEANKTSLEASFKASENKLSDSQHLVQELELTMDSADRLATKIDDAKKTLATFQEHVKHIERRVAEQSNELLPEDTDAAN